MKPSRCISSYECEYAEHATCSCIMSHYRCPFISCWVRSVCECLSLSAESCGCVTWGLSHVFSDVLQPHIRISHHRVILNFLALWVIVNECECDQVGEIEEQVVWGVLTVCVWSCWDAIFTLSPLVPVSLLLGAQFWDGLLQRLRLNEMHTSLLLWMVVWFKAQLYVYLRILSELHVYIMYNYY